MKNTCFICFALLLGFALNAQDFRFGKVSKEELLENIHPLDSSANAAILYRSEEVSFIYVNGEGFLQKREVHERIKIYNKEGNNWATKNIYLYKGSGGSDEEVTGLKGFTYNLSDGKIDKEKLKNESVFEEEYNEFYEIKKLTMPNVQDGSVIEYTYKINSPFSDIDDIEVQKSIPTNKLEVSIATPQYFAYNKWTNPKSAYFFKIEQDKADRVIVTNSNSRKSGDGGFSLQGTSFSTSKSEYFDNILKITEENIPALKEEAYAGNMNNYKSKLSMELSAFLNDFGGIDRSFSTNWEKVSKSIYDNDNFGRQLSRTGFFEDEVDKITAGIGDPFQMGSLLQEYVKSKVSWNGNYGFTSYSSTKKAFTEGVGNVGDINLLLIAMLRYKGVEAYPVLVSTKNNGIPLFPTRKGFDYVVCMIQNENNYMLLDATEKYSSPNVLPQRALNWQGRLIKEDGSSSWIPLNPKSISTESTSLNAKIEDELVINGVVRKSLTQHMALSYRNKYAKLSTEDHIKSIENDKGSLEVEELSLENSVDISEPLKISYNYQYEDIDVIGDKVYFSPLLFFRIKESPFKLETRQYPIDFTSPFEEKYLINILIPDGYAVESLPQSEIIDYNDSAARFNYVSKENGKYLQFNISFELNTPFVDSLNYKIFKEFFEKMIQKQAEQVVLTKA